MVLTEVDEAVLGHGFRVTPKKRPSAHLARDEPSPGRLRVRPAHGPDSDAETFGQLAVCRETAPLREGARGRIFSEGFGNREVAWTRPALKAWAPDCHDDNIAIDTADFHL